MLIAAVVVCLAFASAASAQGDARESRTVQTAQGPVRGYKTDDGKLYQFFGIPYATAPTGSRRFTAPLPPPVWMHPFEAVNKNIMCPQTQHQFIKPTTKMQEDCLVANIHVPTTNQTNLPVLVCVHGGAYLMGFGEMNSPASLAKSQKLIAVTFNYRVGAHGFLCLGTEGAPGNAGMKDQVALLRWVQKNIANFGGNPDDVTLEGGSAGGSAVDLLMLSDMTKGLFHRAIPESGAGLSAWSIQVDPIEYAKDFARIKKFTKTDEDVSALEEYYKSAKFEELASEGLLLRLDNTFHFTPCVERDIGQEMFLKEAPIDILKQGKFRKLPMLYGFANMEGLFGIPYFEERKVKMNERFSDLLPADLQFASKEKKAEIAQVVKEFYFGEKPVNEDTVQGYIDYYSDVMFTYGNLRNVKLRVDAGSDSIYLFEYSLYSPNTQNLYPEFVKDIHGAGHGEYALVIYDTEFSFIFENSEPHKYMKAALQEMWINFITTGKPVPEGSSLPAWHPVGANRAPYMDLGEEIKLKGPLLETRARFWDDIYERFSRTPVAPDPLRSRSEL